MTMTGRAKLAGVMGWPVSHSLSPVLHGHWLDSLGIDGAYVPLPVAPENFAEALRALAKMGFRGVNVTVPHKEAALAAVDAADALACAICHAHSAPLMQRLGQQLGEARGSMPRQRKGRLSI